MKKNRPSNLKRLTDAALRINAAARREVDKEIARDLAFTIRQLQKVERKLKSRTAKRNKKRA
jgi:hypothetical protein